MCDLALYRDNECGSTALSNIFIDEYLAEANDAQIKVYLYLIRMTNANRPTNISDIADRFNHTEKDVCRSLRYWERKGLLSLDYDENGGIVGIRLFDPSNVNRKVSHVRNNSFTPVMNVIPEIHSVAQVSIPTPVSVPATTFTKPSYSLNELKAFKEREDSASLIFIAEQYLKKTLAANDIRSIMFYSDELHFSVELIDFLIQFCVERNKSSFAYMDKVAIDWAENDISTVKQAKAYCSRFDNSYSGNKSARNAAKASAKATTNTMFHQFEQKEYDFDKLEQQLLRRQ
ncbi:MAG: DnaD domain protein [Lachnospiraceae bacterium]|nr:DnaD domain protein [Candidatus Colinaster equi]